MSADSGASDKHADILRKIRKLRALSNSPNVNEAAAAAAKMQDLIETYNIDRALLVEEDSGDDSRAGLGPIVEQTVYTYGGTRATTWQLELVSALARNNGAAVYYNTGRAGWPRNRPDTPATITACGTVEALETIRTMAVWLCDEVDRLYQEERPKGLSRGEGRAWANAFRNGAVVTIRNRLYQARKAAQERKRIAAKIEDAYSVALESDDPGLLLKLDELTRERTRDSDSGLGQEAASRAVEAMGSGPELPDWVEELARERQPDDATPAAGYALARVETAIATVEQQATRAMDWMDGNGLRKGSSRSLGSCGDGFAAGREAGKRANISGAKGRLRG